MYHILTTIPVFNNPLDHKTYINDVSHLENMQNLVRKYEIETGRAFPEDHKLHFYHVNHVIEWEKKILGLETFWIARMMAEEKIPFDPIDRIAKLLVTGRPSKVLVIFQIVKEEDVSKIRNKSLKFALQSDAIFIS
ncbi:hypothetical protein [Brevibacillus sp. 179-C9.3 HS]|uniref:hypothetical protein n=1 Tax=unclassified Brevibacillus TaxID=2684853 RepID=UPI0039A15D6D